MPEPGHLQAAGERRKLPEGLTWQRLGGEWGAPGTKLCVAGAPECLGAGWPAGSLWDELGLIPRAVGSCRRVFWG